MKRKVCDKCGAERAKSVRLCHKCLKEWIAFGDKRKTFANVGDRWKEFIGEGKKEKVIFN